MLAAIGIPLIIDLATRAGDRGIHDTTVALTIALSVLDSTAVVPAAVYGIVMYVLGFLIARTGPAGDRVARPAPGGQRRSGGRPTRFQVAGS